MRRVKVILLFLLMAMLCACSTTSKEDVQRYAGDLFGEAQYLRAEKAEEPPAEDKLVTYYYFTVKGKEYFLADIRISAEDGVEWYTNYKKEKP